jgi:hypothetical protein
MVGSQRPAFIHLFVIPMGSDLNYIADEIRGLPDDFVLVKPSTMVDIFHEGLKTASCSYGDSVKIR